MQEHGDGSARSLLLALAEAREHRLESAQEEDLQALLGLGLIKPADPPRANTFEQKYEDLQARHRLLLQAKAAATRLVLRLAPRSGLGRWLPGGARKPLGPEDSDLLLLHDQLSQLSMVIREVAGPQGLLPRLKHVQDRLLVEDRECLDRMADIDKDLDAFRKQRSASIRVDTFGWVTLTAAGERELPEWSALQELDVVFNLVSGPRRQKIDDYSLFRHDPAALLAFLIENPQRRATLAEAVSSFENLAEPLARHTSVLGVRTTRQQNAFLMRLVRHFREDPKAPYAWANRERLRALSEQALEFLPSSMAADGWPLIYGLDVLVAGRAEVTGPERRNLLGAILEALAVAFPSIPARDGQGSRLAFALLHAVLGRQLTAPSLVDRFLRVMITATREGQEAAPSDIPDEGSRLIFGFHLAQMAEFVPARIPELVARFLRLESALGDRGRQRTIPIQVLLHGVLTLERLERRGTPTAPEEYAATFLRVRNWIDQRKDLGRAFHTVHSQAEDEPFLAANLTARACFGRPGAADSGRPLADVGAAAAYEARDRNSPPLLGQPFGTLLVQ